MEGRHPLADAVHRRSATPLIPDRLASGRLIDLAAPPADYDWRVEMAGPASRLNRFAGQVPDRAYSIAEHQVRGADAILAENDSRDADVGGSRYRPNEDVGGSRYRPNGEDGIAIRLLACRAALAFLIHDQHETLGGDVKRPFADLCEMIAARDGLAPGGMVRAVIQAAKDHLDAGIHAQAGLPFPLPPAIRQLVHAMDERMAAEEMRRFWPQAPLPAAYVALPPIPMQAWPLDSTGQLVTWSWPRAQAEWITRFNRLRATIADLERLGAEAAREDRE